MGRAHQRTIISTFCTFATGEHTHAAAVQTQQQSPRSVQTTLLLGRRSTLSIDQPPDEILTSLPPQTARVQPGLSVVGDGVAETKGVSGLSSKQRVPSSFNFYVNRQADPEPEAGTRATPQRNAVMLAQAWRSFRRLSSSRSVHT